MFRALRRRAAALLPAVLMGFLLLAALAAHAGEEGCVLGEGRWGGGPPMKAATWSGGGEDLLLVGAGTELVLLDAANPVAPVRLGSVTLDHPAIRIAVAPDGQFASVADTFEDLSLIDIADRAAPVRRGSYAWPGLEQPQGMAFDGAGRLFVAVRTLGLAVLDVSDPDDPVLLGESNGPVTDYVFDVALRGHYAYLAQRADGVQVVDISDPTDPQVVGSHAGSVGALSIRIAGSHAYVGSSEGFTILSLANPTAPTTLGSASLSFVYAAQPLSGNRLAVSAQGVRIYDIANPAAPVQLGHWSSPSSYRMAVLGHHAYVTQSVPGDPNLRVIDIGIPSTLTEVGSGIVFDGINNQVSVGAGHVLVAAGRGGVVMLDSSDPAQPERIGRLPLAHHAERVVHVGAHAVVSGNIDPRISIVAPQPGGPTLVASFDTGRYANWLAVDGTRLFVAEGFTGGLSIYGMANPAAPQLLGSYVPTSGGLIVRVAVANGFAFAGEVNHATLRVIDVSSPATPVQIGEYLLPDGVSSIDVDGDIVYIGTQLHGVRILQHDGAGGLDEIASISVPLSEITGVSIDGDRLHVSAGVFSGLLIYDVSDPSDPQLLQQHNTTGDAVSVDAGHGVVALAEGGSGVSTFGCDAAGGNQPPVTVGAIGAQSDEEGEAIFPLSVHPNFDDPDGQALSYTATGLPPGLNIGAGSGVIQGTPPLGSAGTYEVTVTATDPFGLFATQTFIWNILARDPLLFSDGFE